ncbi:MAG: hypothetical protein BZ138_06210, partial [Methanosphaera sp. rholeuAM270]
MEQHDNGVGSVILSYDTFADEEEGLLPYLATAVPYLLRESDVDGLQKLVDDMAFCANELYNLIDETVEQKKKFDIIMNKLHAIEEAQASQSAAKAAIEEELAGAFSVKTSQVRAAEEEAARQAEIEARIQAEAERIASERIAAYQKEEAARAATAAATGLIFTDIDDDELLADVSESDYDEADYDAADIGEPGEPGAPDGATNGGMPPVEPLSDTESDSLSEDPFADFDQAVGLADEDVDSGYRPVDEDPFDIEIPMDDGLPGDLVPFAPDVSDELYIDEAELAGSDGGEESADELAQR